MDGYVTIGTMVDTKDFDSQMTYIESKMLDIEDKLEKADMGFEVGDTQKLEAEYEKLGNQLIDLKKKQEKYNQSIREASLSGLNNIQNQLTGIGNSVSNITKKVGRWALAVFGIRSAYMFVRQSMSVLSQYNETMANQLSNIRLVLATALEPVINRILSLVITLLNYLNYITKAWFGLDLFARASELSSKGIADNLGSGAKSAKEIKKQLAGFDEMNVLQSQEDTSGGAGGGAGGADIPKFDLPEVEIPEWLKWIVDHKDEVIAGLLGIAGALTALKLGLSPLKSLGIGLAIGGIVYAIESLLKYLKDPSWENFGKIIIGIGIAIVGVGIAIGAWPLIIAGVIVAIVGLILSNWEKIKAFFQSGIDWLKGKSDWIHKTFGDTVGNIYDLIVSSLGDLLKIVDAVFTSWKKTFDGFIKFIKGVFSGDWKKAWEGIKDMAGAQIEGLVKIFQAVFNSLKNLFKTLGSTIGNIIGGAFKGIINGILSKVESTINSFFRMINGAIGIINKLPGVNISRMNYISFPRLAKGGIVNMPGRGVPVGNAIAGERGAEGVIPLTDSQQMALIGEAIGRYVTINANITNTMNGRVISRELKKVQNDSDFAYNR